MSYPLEVVLTQLDLHSDFSKNNKNRSFSTLEKSISNPIKFLKI
jgi:hypothetical protein